MKNVLLSSVAFLGLTVGAMAADLPSRVAPVPVAAVPVFTWTGFYVGVQAGYAWGDASAVLIGTSSTGATLEFPFNRGGDYEGFVGGVHAGYNHQLGSFVIGLEADIEASGVDGDFARVNTAGTQFLSADSNISVQGSLRARLGFAFDRALIYATGGVAFANFETDYAFRETVTGQTGSVSYDNSEWGWTLGAGVEYAFANNLTARLEYRYTQFDGFGHPNDFTEGNPVVDVETEFHTVRAGVSYKFGTY